MTGFASLALAAGTIAAAASPAQAGTASLPDPAQGHPYRHGTVPTRGVGHAKHSSGTAAAASSNLQYYGGTDGVGVTSGAPKVHLVFWGSQWGASGTDANGDTTLAGDRSGMAPVLQEFFKGLGTGGETWSGVMTQYCEGIAKGATTCAPTDTHIGYPTDGALAGVWVDGSSAAPDQANGNQIGQEAVSAAAHFGNTDTASNRNVQYVVVSPRGTHPDGYGSSGFCAWHDFTGDNALSGGPVNSPYGPVTFTNLPYIPDQGSNCGANSVNAGSAGTLDGVTIVEGHEYAETITDQHPYSPNGSDPVPQSGGWLDASGEENGDKCAWIKTGQGATQNITLTTGTFAVQSTWSNDFNNGAGGCEISHPIVTNGGSDGGGSLTQRRLRDR
ncbi:hypothetical protein ABZW30_44520 [Kitasatospora sp. NPDC004669]|uniref:hypothetical protein n=1 Tax=Kitasatospora sp. NPDC004669 TaxID=3154555 RepID=UPI0033A872C5